MKLIGHDGWALRREGDGTIPPMMNGKRKQPKDRALLKKFLSESLFETPPARFDLPPASSLRPGSVSLSGKMLRIRHRP